MKLVRSGKSVTLLVWALVMIGLVAGVVTNGIVGLTLSGLNRERLLLLEQENRLSQAVQKLRRLGQEAQQAIGGQLQVDQAPVSTVFPGEEFPPLVKEFRQTVPAPETAAVVAEVERTILQLQEIWRQASTWRERYLAVFEDQRQKRTLTQVRDHLHRLRAALETFQGRQRLVEAQMLRRWRQAEGPEAAELAGAVLAYQTRPWGRVFREIRIELVDLSRLVEILAGEAQLDQLADLKDNQLKPSLERLERQLAILRSNDQISAEEVPIRTVEELKDAIFGRGYAIYQEYQTIRPGEGGLYQLARSTLLLLREREALQASTLSTYQELEAVYPRLTDLTRERAEALAREAEASYTSGSSNLLALSLLTLSGFLGLGWLISRMARRQIDALARLRRQNELILNSAGEGILGLDREGRTIFVNPSGARQLGWDPEELIGRPHLDFLHPCSDGAPCPAETSPIFRTLNEGTVYRLDDQVFWRREGNSFPVEYSATPMLGEKSELEGAVVTFLDISERKEAETTLQLYCERLAAQEEELQRLNRVLEKKVAERTLLLEEKSQQLIATREELARSERLAAIGSLAAGVAHEINNPAAVIRGNSELLLQQLSTEASEREELEEILKQTERIARITKNMLSLAREDRGPVEDLQVNELLTDILAQVSHQVPFGKIRVHQLLASALPPLQVNAERLRQVFTNLILNALQAMEGEGTLTLRTRSTGRGMEITVSDSGAGIPREIREKIFDPFFTTKSTGTGLGLSISYAVVQSLGGSIELDSEIGRGSRFRVWLPLVSQSSAA